MGQLHAPPALQQHLLLRRFGKPVTWAFQVVDLCSKHGGLLTLLLSGCSADY
jgi:hypothetical protein